MGEQKRRRACWAAEDLASPNKMQAGYNLDLTRLSLLHGYRGCKVRQPADPLSPEGAQSEDKTHNETDNKRTCEGKGILCVCKRDGGWGERERGRAGARPSLGQPRCGTSGTSRLRSHGGAAASGCEVSLRERGPERDGHPLPTGEGGENATGSDASGARGNSHAQGDRKENRRVVTL